MILRRSNCHDAFETMKRLITCWTDPHSTSLLWLRNLDALCTGAFWIWLNSRSFEVSTQTADKAAVAISTHTECWTILKTWNSIARFAKSMNVSCKIRYLSEINWRKKLSGSFYHTRNCRRTLSVDLFYFWVFIVRTHLFQGFVSVFYNIELVSKCEPARGWRLFIVFVRLGARAFRRAMTFERMKNLLQSGNEIFDAFRSRGWQRRRRSIFTR